MVQTPEYNNTRYPMEGKTKMANIISATDFNKLRKLAANEGKRVKFDYLDSEGKRTSVDTAIDASTVRDNSLLTRNEANGYRRYLFANLKSDVEVVE